MLSSEFSIFHSMERHGAVFGTCCSQGFSRVEPASTRRLGRHQSTSCVRAGKTQDTTLYIYKLVAQYELGNT